MPPHSGAVLYTPTVLGSYERRNTPVRQYTLTVAKQTDDVYLSMREVETGAQLRPVSYITEVQVNTRFKLRSLTFLHKTRLTTTTPAIRRPGVILTRMRQ